MVDRLSTGVAPLDRALGGGVPAGSTVAVTGPPEAQSGPLLRAGMHRRPTLYISTTLSERKVTGMLEEAVDTDDFTVEYVGIEDPLSAARDALASLETTTNVVIDAMNPLEDRIEEAEYVSFCNDLHGRLAETNSIALLHCPAADPPPTHRELTLAVADLVWDLDVTTETDRIEFYLGIPKFRARDPSDRVLHLELGSDIDVDTSRDIS